jgi:molecular chaperone GrpE
VTQPHPEEQESQAPRVRDRRRIDPETGAVRPAAADAASQSQDSRGDGGRDDLRQQLAERTADLQRVKAEYDNYRRRVERDRLAVADQSLASVLVGLLPVLDDIGRARDHGELEGGFKSVAEGLETTLTKLGLLAFGDVGEPFDPTVHEALMHSYSDQVTEPTCVQVLAPGYRLGERILRPARVAVAEPPPAAAAENEAEAAAPENEAENDVEEAATENDYGAESTERPGE